MRLSMSRAVRAIAMIAVLAISAINLSGCAAGTTPAPSASSDGKLHVVASISNWADIAKQIGGDYVDVTSIISDPNKDPHSYEATPRDQLEVSRADITIINGGGYDTYMQKLVNAAASAAANSKAVETLTVELTQGASRTNPHFWFDFAVVRRFAQDVYASFVALDKAHTPQYQTNLANFDQQLSGLMKRADSLSKITTGYRYFATEAIANDLLNASGFVDKTPKAFSDAIENETDVPPATMQASIDMINRHEIDYFVLNKQTSSAQVDKLVAVARDAEVRTVSFSELLPENTTYIAWMTANLKTLNPGM
jgi:zinc/manganese transport system substrate-binding protein